jgi:hypothetical protein
MGDSSHVVVGPLIKLAPRMGPVGIAKLIASDCEGLAKAGLCGHFGGVVGPEAESIGAGVMDDLCADFDHSCLEFGQRPSARARCLHYSNGECLDIHLPPVQKNCGKHVKRKTANDSRK